MLCCTASRVVLPAASHAAVLQPENLPGAASAGGSDCYHSQLIVQPHTAADHTVAANVHRVITAPAAAGQHKHQGNLLPNDRSTYT